MVNTIRGASRALFPLLVLAACQGHPLDLVGTVERRIIELAAPVSETIVEIPVRRGQEVAAGEVLVRLDTKVAEAELPAAEAARNAAQAGLDEAERELKRFEGLRASRVVTPQQYDAARRARDELVAIVAEREARVAQASERLEDLTIRAWTAGTVDQLPFDPGERLPPGGVAAVILADDVPWVRVWMPADAVARTTIGTPAQVTIQGLDQPLTGKVTEISREPAFTPHYALTERESAHLVYETRIELEGAPPGLRHGLAARVRVGRDGGG
jgi:HlyD family secretion protein